MRRAPGRSRAVPGPRRPALHGDAPRPGRPLTTPFFSFVRPLAVVAFGGNALLRPEDPGTTAAQLARAREAVRDLLPVLARGYELVVVHGNGPQVGNILIQSALADGQIPPDT